MCIQEETLMVLSFAKELASSSTVGVVLSTAADNEEVSADNIIATRLNPYTYTFIAPCGQQQSSSSVLFIFTARCAIVRSAVLRSHVCLSVCLSVMLVDQDHIGWKSWKLISRTISPTPSLFIGTQSPSTYSPGKLGKFQGD